MNSAYPSRRAERSLFKELFESPAKVHLNGGVITGGAIPNHGLPLDGTTQYATFAIGATDLTRDEINIEIVFTPNFDWDNDAHSAFVDTTGGQRYYLLKQNNASSNVILVVVGNATIAAIPSASYSAYWRQGERNRLLLSSVSTDTDVWLNGTQILTNDNTAWTPKYPTGISVGVALGGGNEFDGTIHSVEFRAGLLTQLDVDAIESDSLFNYRNRANLVLDMKEQTERAGTILGTTELLVDGDMEDTGDPTLIWTVGNNATLTKNVTNPHGGAQSLSVAYNGTNNPRARQTILTAGHRYRLAGWTRGDGTAFARIYYTSTLTWSGTTSTAWQPFDITFLADVAQLDFYALVSVAGHVDYDDITVYETDELLSDGDMEDMGVGAWTQGNNADFTKETGTPYEGTQVLRIARDGTNDPYVTQAILNVGQKYRVTGRARSDGNALPRMHIGTGSFDWTGDISTDWQYFNVEAIADNADFALQAITNTSTEYCEFDQVSVKPVLAQTLDKSPNGHVCLLGDGFTAADMPTFENPGFDFDGTNQYMLLPQASGIFNNAGQTIACLFQPDFAADDGVFHYLLDTPVGTRYLIAKDSVNQLQVYLGNSSIIIATLAAFVDHWRVDGLNVLTVVGTSGATTLWLNGVVVGTNSGVWTPVDPAVLYLGASSGIASFYDGGMEGFMTWPFQLSPLQVRDLTISLGVNV